MTMMINNNISDLRLEEELAEHDTKHKNYQSCVYVSRGQDFVAWSNLKKNCSLVTHIKELEQNEIYVNVV